MNNNQISYKGVTVERLLDYLADNKIYDGVQPVGVEDGLMHVQVDEPSKTDYPVLIGDVLEKINEYPYQDSAQNSIDLVQKWGPCKFNKSLNEILCGDIKTEDQLIYAATNYYEPVTFFKNPNTQALFEFLVNTFYDELK